MKVSKKMQSTIDRLERKYGKLEKSFGIELEPSNRVGRGFYDFCQLSCKLFQSLYIVVAHDGSYYKI